MFRIIYYLGGLISALFGNFNKISYYAWIYSTELVRQDTLRVLIALTIILLFALTGIFWTIGIIAFIFLINVLGLLIGRHKMMRKVKKETQNEQERT